MVAITTDTNSDRYTELEGHARLIEFPSRAAAGGGHPIAPEVLARVLLVVAAAALFLVVAVGTAAWGRLLDGERGIPESAPVSTAVVADGP